MACLLICLGSETSLEGVESQPLARPSLSKKHCGKMRVTDVLVREAKSVRASDSLTAFDILTTGQQQVEGQTA